MSNLKEVAEGLISALRARAEDPLSGGDHATPAEYLPLCDRIEELESDLTPEPIPPDPANESATVAVAPTAQEG